MLGCVCPRPATTQAAATNSLAKAAKAWRHRCLVRQTAAVVDATMKFERFEHLAAGLRRPDDGL